MPQGNAHDPADGAASRALRCALGLLCAAVLAAAGFLALPALLEVADPLPERADAIYVFPGEIPGRPRCGAELLRSGLAPVLLFTGGRVPPAAAAVGAPLTDAEIGARVALDVGAPPTALVVVARGTSTSEDAATVAEWARGHGARRIVAVTSPLHARRARRALRAALGPVGTAVALVPCGERLAFGDAWWLDEGPLLAVVEELGKSILYGLRSLLPATPGAAPTPLPARQGRAATRGPDRSGRSARPQTGHGPPWRSCARPPRGRPGTRIASARMAPRSAPMTGGPRRAAPGVRAHPGALSPPACPG